VPLVLARADTAICGPVRQANPALRGVWIPLHMATCAQPGEVLHAADLQGRLLLSLQPRLSWSPGVTNSRRCNSAPIGRLRCDSALWHIWNFEFRPIWRTKARSRMASCMRLRL